ncbi:MAG: hypothetical protein QNJ90_01805 [Planctomycetota bacterium]|nr:hypothetical protein [Planctomycetota bacterium]
MPRSRHALRGPVAALLVLSLLSAALLLGPVVRPAEAKEKLKPLATNQMNRGDQLGFNWDPNTQGVIRDGTNDCFDGAMNMKVNGGDFRASGPPMQTKDGGEYVLRGAVGDIAITRRIRLDLVKGAARYVEVLQNKSKRAVTVTLEMRSMLGSSCQQVMTDQGRGVLNGPLEKKESGLIAVHGGGSRPSVLFQLRTPRSKVVPQIQVKSNRTFTFTWVVKIAAGKSAAVLHSVAQRRWGGPPMGKQLKAEFEPFLERKWAAGLPGAVRSALVNHVGSAGGTASLSANRPADQAIREVAAAYEVERGDDSVVLIERDKPLKGEVLGETLQVATRLGEASVPFDEVAVLLGGANRGRSMRLYLRDGEVLAGAVRAEQLQFVTQAGLEIPLDPAGIDALFLPKDAADGKLKPGSAAFLTQLDGTRLALAKAEGGQLDAVTPWGDLDLPLEEAVRIDFMREPVPGLWILTRNGSRVPVAIQGGSLKVESLRFGPVEVEPGSIAAWQRNGVDVPLAKNEDGETTGPLATHTRLAGECFLVGALADEQLHADTLAGSTAIRIDQILKIERDDEDESIRPAFVFTLKSGETLNGRLRERLISVQTPYGLCRAPVLHLRGYRWYPPPAEPGPDEPGDGKVDEAKPEDAKPESGDAPKDAPPKDSAPKKDAPGGKGGN